MHVYCVFHGFGRGTTPLQQKWFVVGHPCSIACRILSEVETLKVDEKVSKGKTEEISMQVGKEIFSQFTGTKVQPSMFLRTTLLFAV